MILTGSAIYQAWERGEIDIDPFDKEMLNPNSYNYRLSDKLIVVRNNAIGQFEICEEIRIDGNGFTLRPNYLYLGATHEIIGSSKYVTTLLGRSSIGRLGLFLNITADLGHVGSHSQWTLEIEVVQPLKIYPLMKIGQAAFWNQQGLADFYHGRYHNDRGPIMNRDLSLTT